MMMMMMMIEACMCACMCRWSGFSSRWPRNESSDSFHYSSLILSGRACGTWWVCTVC